MSDKMWMLWAKVTGGYIVGLAMGAALGDLTAGQCILAGLTAGVILTVVVAVE